MDRMSIKKRSYTMSRIRSKNTLVERVVFKALRKNKVYFSKHYIGLPGKPDIVVTKKKLAVFIDGDFWHGWRFKLWRHKLPKKYWLEKIENNIIRDIRNRRALKVQGWKVLRIWEHQLERNAEKTIVKVLKFLKQ